VKTERVKKKKINGFLILPDTHVTRGWMQKKTNFIILFLQKIFHTSVIKHNSIILCFFFSFFFGAAGEKKRMKIILFG